VRTLELPSMATLNMRLLVDVQLSFGKPCPDGPATTADNGALGNDDAMSGI
ncbi:MAG: hypothetical protein JWO42_3683, partial [Chloroflexi bacterium]|nr:hypothetical protein [Chloroflexota bacterium]